jgi:hypothetical protein
MISRIWHGWTVPANADAYEALLKSEIFVGIGSSDCRLSRDSTDNPPARVRVCSTRNQASTPIASESCSVGCPLDSRLAEE